MSDGDETDAHYFKGKDGPLWNHWFTLAALTCDGGHHGWLIGNIRLIRD
ncbi:hypothetical protein FHT44_005174 [Mycolicibacterium sp. BK634]|nr:hypothetical protein [Mycolicibacterium sp. BK634]